MLYLGCNDIGTCKLTSLLVRLIIDDERQPKRFKNIIFQSKVDAFR